MLGFWGKTGSGGITRLNNRDNNFHEEAKLRKNCVCLFCTDSNICLLSTFIFLRIKLFFLLCCEDSSYFHFEIIYIYSYIPHETFYVIILSITITLIFFMGPSISFSFQFSFKSKVLFFTCIDTIVIVSSPTN